MKKTLFLFAFTLIISSISYSKGAVPYCSGCEYVELIQDLPNDDDLYSAEYDAHLDVGFIYKQFWLVWIPIWNYDGQYCFKLEGTEDTYFEMSEEDKTWLTENYDVDFSSTNPISFWNKIGGKLLLILILIGAVAYYAMGGDDDEVTEEA